MWEHITFDSPLVLHYSPLTKANLKPRPADHTILIKVSTNSS
jgi:hypothetical protein